MALNSLSKLQQVSTNIINKQKVRKLHFIVFLVNKNELKSFILLLENWILIVVQYNNGTIRKFIKCVIQIEGKAKSSIVNFISRRPLQVSKNIDLQ